MKIKTRIASLFVLIVLALSACVIPGTTTPTPKPGGGSTPIPGGNEAGVFTDAANGISLRYPTAWTLAPGDDEQTLASISSPDGTFQSFLYLFPMTEDTLEDAATSLKLEVLTGLEDLQTVSDGLITLEDGTQAWQTVVTADANGNQLKISLLSAVRGARLAFLMSFGAPDSYDYYESSLAEMISSLHMELPALYDIPREQALVYSGGESTNPREYDPATTHGSGDKKVFGGLVAFDPQMNLVADLAESWDVSADGMVYTFHLRPNATFHDGRPVTAGDVVYSWERAANPATNSDTVLTYLGDIAGVAEMHAGEADHISGLKVIDDHTLQVTIDAPKPYFLMKLTYPTGFVLDQANVESGEEWYRTPNGTGPYKLVSWERFKVIILEANPNYHLGAPAIPYIVVQLYSGIPIRLYESGEVDVAGVASYDVERFSDPEEAMHAELISAVDLCTSYVTFDVNQPPFDDVKVRQAFTMAFDRQQYIDVVVSGVGIPAKGLYPPALPGYNLELEGLPYDPEGARKLLAESKYGGPEGLPPIVYTDAGIGNQAGSSVAAIAQMWEQNLGVTITIENLESNLYYDKIHAGEHGQIFEGGWCADYPDPENFADVLFHTGAQQNSGHYSNPELDSILDRARIETDVDTRIQLYQQAEQMIVNDAPAIFIMHSLSYVVVKPYLQGYVLTPVDMPLEWYMWLDWSK